MRRYLPSRATLVRLVLVALVSASVMGWLTCVVAPHPKVVLTNAESDSAYLRHCVVRVAAAGGLGSGVWIAPDLILTAYHVVDNMKPGDLARISNGHSDSVPALLVRFDALTDLAILQVVEIPKWTYRVARALESDPEIDAEVTLLGFPLGGLTCVRTDGRVQSLDNDGYMFMSSPAIWGNSGGPAFVRDSAGQWRLVSICQQLYVSGQSPITHMVLGVRPIQLRLFLSL